MAVAIGGTPTGTASNSVASLSVAHTAAGTNRAAFFGVGLSAGSPPTIDSATYGGNAMTAAWATVSGDFARNRGWYIAGDGSIATTSQTVEVTLSGTADEIVISVESFQGVDSSSPVGTAVTSGTGTNAPSVTVGSVGADDMVASFVYAVASAGNITTAGSGPTGTGHTLGTEHVEPTTFGYGGSSYKDGAEGGAMAWTLDDDAAPDFGTTLGAIAFKPVAAGGGGNLARVNHLPLLGVS